MVAFTRTTSYCVSAVSTGPHAMTRSEHDDEGAGQIDIGRCNIPHYRCFDGRTFWELLDVVGSLQS